MKIDSILIVFSAICLQTVVHSANILFYFGLSTYSHRVPVWPLIEKLVENGHNVTFLNIYENKNPHPNVTEIVVKQPSDLDFPDFLNLRIDHGFWMMKLFTLTLPRVAIQMCEIILDDPKVIEMSKTSHFDLVVIDFLYNDCGLGFVHKFKAKHVVFGTSTIAGYWPEAYGFNSESSWIPDQVISFQMPLSFPHRVISTLVPFLHHVTKRFYMYPILQKMISEKLEITDLPSLDELDRNASLILMNTHFSEELPRSIPPFIIPIGGTHCKESTKPLPKNIAKFIDAAGDKGFIYISFGSGVEFSLASDELQDIFYQAAANIDIQFLWKWGGPRPENMPANIHTEAWMPQQDILAHPKIRAFLTHGGLLGAQEAIYHGVPMIAFPVFAEQDYNADRLERTGRGIMLEIVDLTQEKLENAINSILNDKKYRETMKITSRRFKDRPMSPVDTALWWTEYVLRQEDTDFMRPVQATHLYWFQRHLLDVWAFLFTIFALSVFLFFYILKILCSSCLSKPNEGSKTKPKTKIS